MFHFYAYVAKLKYILRWGLKRNVENENVKEHSFDVSVIAHALALIRNRYFGGQVDANQPFDRGEKAEAIVAPLRDRFPEADIRVERLWDYPGLGTAPDAEVVVKEARVEVEAKVKGIWPLRMGQLAVGSWSWVLGLPAKHEKV